MATPVLPFELPSQARATPIYNADNQCVAWLISLLNGELLYAPQFFDADICDRAMNYLIANLAEYDLSHDWKSVAPQELDLIGFHNIKWKQEYIKVKGKTIPLPRLTAWYGDEGKDYRYSGIDNKPHAWNDGLTYIKNWIEKFCGTNFNSVLLNWYRNGSDSIGWHSDDEKELGYRPVIASFNLGETRQFMLKHNDDPSLQLNLPLSHGTLLVMQGELQHYWQHSVPKTTAKLGNRINLTFRRVVN